MLSLRRRPKNSLLGVHVCAPWKDGYFYSGVIEAVKSKPTGEHTYTILFEDDYIAEVDEGEIVGPGFNPVGVRAVKDGQRVFISFKGREVEARVVKTRLEFNEVLVQILDRPDTVVAVRPEEMHLMKGEQFSESIHRIRTLDNSSSNISCPVPCKMKAHGIDSCRWVLR